MLYSIRMRILGGVGPKDTLTTGPKQEARGQGGQGPSSSAASGRAEMSGREKERKNPNTK